MSGPPSPGRAARPRVPGIGAPCDPVWRCGTKHNWAAAALPHENTSTQKDQRPRRVSYNNCRPLPAASASRPMLPHPIKVEGAGLTYTYRGDTTVEFDQRRTHWTVFIQTI